MIGPEDSDDTNSSFQDWRDHKLDGKTSAFTYNPAPPEGKGGPFPEPDDAEAPEKM